MKIAVELEINTIDGSFPLKEDIKDKLWRLLDNRKIVWNDSSLDRKLEAIINIDGFIDL